jgi:integrase
MGQWAHREGDLARGKSLRSNAGIAKLSPHDCRRACARLCHAAGGKLEQIQFLLGHVSAKATEQYLVCWPCLNSAVNDHTGLEP